MTRYLVVTADDFGYCSKRNRGIVTVFLAGGITRTSLLVTGAAAAQASQLATQHCIPLGLHFNVTEGLPVSDCQTILSLLTDDEVFRGKVGFREAVLAGTVVLADVQCELRAQIARFQELTGHLPQYVDGHNHIHVLPGVCTVIAEVLSEMSVYGTRVPNEALLLEACDWLPTQRMDFYHQVVDEARKAADIFTRHKLQFSDGFVGMTTMGADMMVERLEQLLSDTFLHLETASPGGLHASISPGSIINCDMETGEWYVKHEDMSSDYHSTALSLPSDSKTCEGGNRCCNRDQRMGGRRRVDGVLSEAGHTCAAQNIHPYAADPKLDGTAATEDALRVARDGVVVELMVHPGYPCVDRNAGCGVGPDDFAQSADRQHELDVLRSLAWRRVCQRNRLELLASIPFS